MFQAQNRENKNNIWKAAVSSKIIMTTSVTRLCFTTQHKTCKTKIKTDFIGLRPTVSDPAHYWCALPNVVLVVAFIIIIIITKEYDYGGVMSEDCKDTLQTK